MSAPASVVVVIGKGSHVSVVQSILLLCNKNTLLRNVSIEEFEQETKASSSSLPMQAICAIGDNETRRNVVARAPVWVTWISAVHPSAVLDSNASLGVGTCICAGAVICSGARIGDHCIVNTLASVDHHCRVDDFVHVAPHAAVCGNCTVGQGCLIGTSACLLPKTQVAPWSMCKANELLKHSTAPIPMYIPWLPDAYLKDAQTAIQQGAISSQAKSYSFIDKAEQVLVRLLQVKHVLLVNNGTSATHCLFLALKFKYPHITNVYVPNNVYVAVWNTALYEYATEQLEVLPLDPSTWNMDTCADTLTQIKPHSAVVIVHNVGNIVNVPRLQRLRPDLVFVEDNCEGFLGSYEQKPTGAAAFCSSISFYANKIVTTGEGGAFATNDSETYNYIRQVCNQGVTERRYVHNVLGYNYRITNIQAALLYPQLLDVASVVTRKKEIFQRYRARLLLSSQEDRLTCAQMDADTEAAPWLFAVRISDSKYSELQLFLSDRLIETRPVFYPITVHPHLQSITRRCSDNKEQEEQCQLLSEEACMLPSFPALTNRQIDYICDCILLYVRQLKPNPSKLCSV